ELFDIVNDDNLPLGMTKPRTVVHEEMKDWHRVTHIWIANESNQILCQHRSPTKDKNPGKWQSFFGGHLKVGQSYEANAVSELLEELGLNIKSEQLIPLYVRKSESQKHFAQVYLVKRRGGLKDFHFNDREVAQVKWYSLEDLERAIFQGQFCNSMDNKVKEYLLK
ncbi:NUDIX domain-containing protein, partial [bacterium]